MKYKIFYPTPLTEIDPDRDNTDVCVELTDGRRYTFTVITPDGLKELMKKDGIPFVSPGTPFVIVERLTDEIIRRAVEAYIKEDDALLRMYGGDRPD